MNELVKLDPWVWDILVDPLSKTPFRCTPTEIVCDYGRRYKKDGSILDLRLPFSTLSSDLSVWRKGQTEYERWAKSIASTDATQDYEAEREGVRAVYEVIPIRGRCIDIAGHQGRLRAFLDPEQEYVSVDAFVDVFEGIHLQQRLLKAYPVLREPVNFVCAMAEHLPFASCSFDIAHMRSCLDHFYNPALALLEAFRVLRPGGELVIGLYVEGGRDGHIGLQHKTKDTAKRVLGAFMDRFRDHHVWHPSYPALCSLIKGCGFEIQQTHWQAGYEDSVCYVQSRKPS